LRISGSLHARTWRNEKFAEFDSALMREGIGAIAGSENRHSWFCKFFRKNSDSLQLPQHFLYAYLNLNQLNHPKVSKFRFSPGQYAS